MKFELLSPFILDKSNCKLIKNNDQLLITSISTPHKSDENSLCFVSKQTDIVPKGFVIAKKEMIHDKNRVLVSLDPKLDFIRVANLIIAEVGINNQYKHLIEKSAKISKYSYIHKGVQIGKNSLIESFVTLNSGTQIGDNCVIKSGTSIGHGGFGFHRDEKGVPIEFPNLGRVIIGNNVQIGANNTVARGALKHTLIGDNSKIDDHCHIAHNSQIGKNAIICPFVDILGSVNIGDNCYVAPNVVFRNGITVGNNVFVGTKSFVNRNVPDGAQLYGIPAKIKNL